MRFNFRTADVICGHSPNYRTHPGNIWLRDRVSADFERYNRSTKLEKTKLSQAIVDGVALRGGRFLTRSKSDVWKQLEKANEKLAAMFRGVREQRKRASKLLQRFQTDPDFQLMQMYLNDPDFQMMIDSLCQKDPDVSGVARFIG